MIKVGLIQLLVEGGEPERNLERARGYIAEARRLKCDLVILPETMDFGWTHPCALEEATPFPNPSTSFFQEMAQKFNCMVCVGLTEKCALTKKNFNSALLFDRNGDQLLHYRKINLLDVELPYYEVGSSLNVVSTDFGTIGLNICSDNYRESTVISETLARMGAQLILSPSAWTVHHTITEEETSPYQDKWTGPMSSVASLYDIHLISCTSVGYLIAGPYIGKKMIGQSLVVGPEGIVKRGGFSEVASELLTAELNLNKTQLKGQPLSLKVFNSRS